jgi:hypothetical protein
MAAGREQPQLLGGQRRAHAPPTQGEEVAGAARVHAQATEILRIARQRAAALGYQAARRGRPDAGHP